MKAVRTLSLLLMISGALTLTSGLILYFLNDVIQNFFNVLIYVGISFIFGAIVCVCLAQQYED